MRSVGEGQAALSGPLGLLLCARARGAASARLGGGIAPADGQPSGLNPETGLEFEPAGVRHGRCPVTLPAGGAQAGELCSNLTFDAFGTVDIKLYIHIDLGRLEQRLKARTCLTALWGLRGIRLLMLGVSLRLFAHSPIAC